MTIIITIALLLLVLIGIREVVSWVFNYIEDYRYNKEEEKWLKDEEEASYQDFLEMLALNQKAYKESPKKAIKKSKKDLTKGK